MKWDKVDVLCQRAFSVIIEGKKNYLSSYNKSIAIAEEDIRCRLIAVWQKSFEKGIRLWNFLVVIPQYLLLDWQKRETTTSL